MSHVKLSDSAMLDAKRLYDFLAQYDFNAADKSSLALVKALKQLQSRPTIGTPVPDRSNIRKVVVDFGASGYLIFHKRYEKTDTNFVARIIHQKEWYDEATIGLAEEKAEDVNTQGIVEP